MIFDFSFLSVDDVASLSGSLSSSHQYRSSMSSISSKVTINNDFGE